jgi:hypothetical protein
VAAGEEHRFSVDLAGGTYDLRIHFSSPTELAPAPPVQDDYKFDFFIEGILELNDYVPASDPALDPSPGRDQVVAKEFWSRGVNGGDGLQMRSLPVPFMGGPDGDSFELAIEVAPTTHTDLHTKKVVVKEAQP